ncbi:MAG: 50S ribosomal protein L29 [Candidatus Daviesbacteria bacterium]|nr:50S ribosomal protein L29 [Candidatus Daviesbacteria bacterium]
MKKTEILEIKKMEQKPLLVKIKDAQKNILGLILDKSTGKATNLKVVKNKRKDLAQMMTILRQKQMLFELENKHE